MISGHSTRGFLVGMEGISDAQRNQLIKAIRDDICLVETFKNQADYLRIFSENLRSKPDVVDYIRSVAERTFSGAPIAVQTMENSTFPDVDLTAFLQDVRAQTTVSPLVGVQQKVGIEPTEDGVKIIKIEESNRIYKEMVGDEVVRMLIFIDEKLISSLGKDGLELKIRTLLENLSAFPKWLIKIIELGRGLRGREKNTISGKIEEIEMNGIIHNFVVFLPYYKMQTLEALSTALDELLKGLK